MCRASAARTVEVQSYQEADEATMEEDDVYPTTSNEDLTTTLMK
jgi:hypothetical protein